MLFRQCFDIIKNEIPNSRIPSSQMHTNVCMHICVYVCVWVFVACLATELRRWHFEVDFHCQNLISCFWFCFRPLFLPRPSCSSYTIPPIINLAKGLLLSARMPHAPCLMPHTYFIFCHCSTPRIHSRPSDLLSSTAYHVKLYQLPQPESANFLDKREWLTSPFCLFVL